MTRGLWIVWSGRGGELDRRFVGQTDADNPSDVLADMLQQSELADGDVITITYGESEG